MIRFGNKSRRGHGVILCSGLNSGYFQADIVSNQSVYRRICLLYACINYKTICLRPVYVCKNSNVVCWQRFIKQIPLQALMAMA